MNADENPYESPQSAVDADPLPTDRRRFHTVVGMWVSFGFALTFGALVLPNSPLPDREYLLNAYRVFSVVATALSVLTACYAVQLIRLRRTSDIIGGSFGLICSIIPLGWGFAAIDRAF